MNNATITGNLGADPQLYTTGKTAVCSVNIADNKYWKDKASGETKTKARWHRLVFFGDHAERFAKTAKKGDQIVVVSSEIEYNKFTDTQGVERTQVEFHVRQYQLMNKRSGEGNAQPQRQQQNPAQANQEQDYDFSEDIPF